MRILQLAAENIKRLKVVSIKPDGSIIQLSGPNGAGKSSVLDCIAYALAGKWAIPSKALRNGAEIGRITIKLGDGETAELIVSRVFTKGGEPKGELFVESADGKAKFVDPQTMLKGLLGELTFDPLEFIRGKESKEKTARQLDTLRGMVKLDVDYAALEAAYQTAYETRRELKKEIKGLETRRAAIIVPDGTPSKPLDISTMVDSLQRAGDANAALQAEKAKRNDESRAIEAAHLAIMSYKTRADELRNEIARLEKQAAEELAQVLGRQKKLEALPALAAPVDTAALAAEITAARVTNEAVTLKIRREELTHEIEQKTLEETALNTAMDKNEAQRKDAVRRAKMPLEGLSFTETGVTFNDLPLEQASGAEQLRVSVAIAMALNPRLRVMSIKDGSLLDSESLKMLATMAEAADYQIWMEVVDTSGKVGIVMEDGEVAAVNPSPVAPEAKQKKPRKKKGEQ